jgi:hypothetical protein
VNILFEAVYATSTIGTLLRELSFRHARQLESLLRPVYGHAKQGASYGHTKIAGKQALRKWLSPLAATISTDLAPPVIAGMRLRAGRTGSGKGASRMVAQAAALAPSSRWC